MCRRHKLGPLPLHNLYGGGLVQVAISSLITFAGVLAFGMTPSLS